LVEVIEFPWSSLILASYVSVLSYMYQAWQISPDYRMIGHIVSFSCIEKSEFHSNQYFDYPEENIKSYDWLIISIRENICRVR